MKKSLLVLVFCLAFATSLSAQVTYNYIDSTGVTLRSNQIIFNHLNNLENGFGTAKFSD